MSYRVCIPTAGLGSRLGNLTQFINKSLVSVANRPIISHIIDKFLDVNEFVIALGYKGELVKEFLTLAYPTKKFFFEQVHPYEGSGSGLGLSLNACKEHLQQPFIFVSCDTLVKEKIPAPLENWIAYADVEDISEYRTLAFSSTGVDAILEKGDKTVSGAKAYIGLAGIHDFKSFWKGMEQGGNKAIEVGEVCGLRNIVSAIKKTYKFTWFDTGNAAALDNARSHYREAKEPNILEKANEAIWFISSAVIKFSADQKFISNRVKRVGELEGFVPEITASSVNMYRYSKVKGEVLSEVTTLPLFRELLKHSLVFWEKKFLSSAESFDFKSTCMKFYREKTFERVDLFYHNFKKKDGMELINGIEMRTLNELLISIDWNWLAEGLPGRFHGDFHFENILWNEDEKKFVFLDWRQDFGGLLNVGDIYYDLAKLLHGLIINHEIIAHNHYQINWQSQSINFDFHRKQILVECEEYFNSWLENQGYDRKKVRVLTALIFLNIAALHHDPYCFLLFALGKSMLKNELEN